MEFNAPLYPAWLQLHKAPVLVVGAGRVARRRTAFLLESRACPRVVSPEGLPEFSDWKTGGEIEWIEREFRGADVEGYRLVFACTDRPEVNREVVRAARSRAAWVSSCTGQEAADLFPAAFVRRGVLGVSVTSSAAAPTLSRVLRNCLAEVLDERWSNLAEDLTRERGADPGALEARIREEFRRSLLRWLGPTP